MTAEDQLKRIDIRAPQDGIVHQLTVHTVGGVIKDGEPIMLIVPQADMLIVEARVSPNDIDHVATGQKAVLRFSGLNQRTTPELNGEVSNVSADAIQDQRTGSTYFLVRITLPEPEIARLGAVKLVPGMPVEAFIQTGERTMLSYMIKPIMDQAREMIRNAGLRTVAEQSDDGVANGTAGVPGAVRDARVNARIPGRPPAALLAGEAVALS